MWRAREIESEISAGGSSQIPFAFQRLLRLRGVNLEAASHFLNPRISDLRDPYLMTNMKKAIDRLCLAFERGEKVAVYGDFDLDGTSGLALLYQGLTSLGFKNVGRYQPKRLSEGYGLHYGGLKDLSEQGYSLVVTVDVGITAIKTCELAKDLPLEVIITDHHLPEETLPAAFAVVNPNQNDDTSGLGYLCGAGVGFYLLRALKRGFMERGWVEEANRCDLKEALEFFTIATLTDMVPLVEDNRALVKMGLQKLSQTNKPGLKQLLKELKMDQKLLTGQDVAIRFAPKLNALSRMESEVLPIDLYLAATEQEAIRLVEVVHRTNSNRVKFQNDAFEEALLKASEQTEWPFIFIASPKFHRGVVGIVASKLCETFGKPSFVGSVDPDGLTVVGSARRPDESNLHLVELLHAAAEHFERSGGHAGAAGFEELARFGGNSVR
ncbi:MAG: DHH family phosphoesterase, partial [Bdellovibrionota bacterium]